MIEPSASIYPLLEVVARSAPGNHHRPVQGIHEAELASHVIESDGGLAFYVAIPAETERGVEIDALGVILEVRSFNQFDEGKALMLRLRDPKMRAPFFALVDDALLRPRQSGQTLAQTLRTVVAEWQTMFDDSGSAVLTVERQMGLLAELHLLENLLEAGFADALDTWMHGGPTSRHDFASRRGDVEVKATHSRESFLLSIHGIDQLAVEENRALHIYAEQFELHPKGETLPEVVDRLKALAPSPPQLILKLASAGYIEGMEERYSARFFLVRRKARIVDDGMPRLTRAMLPAAADPEWIKAVSYKIDFGPVEGLEGEEALTLILEALAE